MKLFKNMKINTESLIKIILAILLILCLLDMPYGYYQVIRFIMLIGFTILAYYEYERKNIPLAIVFLGLAILFQPLAKIGLGREVWNFVDVIIAIGLIILVFKRKNEQ